MKDIRRYEEETDVADKKAQERLFQKFSKQMEKSSDEKMELLSLMTFLQQSEDPDVSESARQCVDHYFAVTDPDGSLNKEAFEKKIGEIEEYKFRHVYEPAVNIIRNDNGVHSDKWMYDHLNSDYKMGVLQAGFQGIVANKLLELSGEIEEQYPGIESSVQAAEPITQAKRQELLNGESQEKKTEIDNAIRFFGMEFGIEAGKTKEYLADQKKKRKMEPTYDSYSSRQRASENVYKLFAEKDMSFLSDEEYRKVRDTMVANARSELKRDGWEPEDPASRSLYEISTTIDALGKELKDASGLRISDSSQFNAIKDRVEEIQKLVKKGSLRENREALFASVTKLNKECQAYLDKNAGERRTERGKRRKDIVGRLEALAVDQTQKLLAPEAEQDIKRDMLKAFKETASDSIGELRDSQYARDMEKLLVMSGRDEASAKRQVFEAMTVMGGRPGNIEKMENVLNQCRHAIGQMDVRLEALKELGVKEPEKLNKDEMRKILTAPENQNQLNDFYTSLHAMTERMSMEGTHPGLQAVYRSMQLDGTLEKDVDYERANAAILKGLSGESAWQKARKAYEAGDRSMDVTEMAALKCSLGVQRELIIENGTLSGQNRCQSEAMENLARDTEEILKREPREEEKLKLSDYRSAMDGLTLERVMENNDRIPAVELAVAGIVGRNNNKVLFRHIEELSGGGDWKDLEPGTHITQLDRSYTVNHLVMGYMLSQGYDLTTAIDDPEARRMAAKDLRKFLETHTTEVDENKVPKTENDRKKIQELAKFYESIQENILQMKAPNIDYNDPIQRAAHKCELSHMVGMMLDIDQSMTDPSKIQGFAEAYGGKERMDRMREEQAKVQRMFSVGNADRADARLTDMKGRLAGQIYGKAIAGKSVRELQTAFKDSSFINFGILEELGMQDYQYEADVYLKGEKTITIDDVIENCVSKGIPKEEFIPIKNKIEELENAKTREIPKKEQGEKKQSVPVVERVSLNELLSSERKSAPARRPAGERSSVKERPEEKERKSMGGPGIK